MKALSLYSGGCDGISLAASWVGIETLAYCDSDPACRAVLAERHPNKPIFESDEDVTIDALRTAGIDPAGIDIVFGGPPCQIASVAGKRLGAADERNRWPEFLRIVRDVGPRWTLAENVPGLLTVDHGRLFGDILREMAEMGYRVGWGCWGAADIGAPHRRERLFIVGYSERVGRSGESRRWAGSEPEDGCRNVENPGHLGRGGALHVCERSRRTKTIWSSESGGRATTQNDRISQSMLGRNAPGISSWMDEVAKKLESQQWPAGKGEQQYDWEPPRVAEGVPNRATRIRMIGNACPPQQYFPILAAIKACEEEHG